MIVRWCMGVKRNDHGQKRNGSWFQGGRNRVQDQKGEQDETDIRACGGGGRKGCGRRAWEWFGIRFVCRRRIGSSSRRSPLAQSAPTALLVQAELADPALIILMTRCVVDGLARL